jgi:hypothetical protein
MQIYKPDIAVCLCRYKSDVAVRYKPYAVAVVHRYQPSVSGQPVLHAVGVGAVLL